VFIKAGERKVVKFIISEDDLKFWKSDMTYGSEKGDFKLMIGGSSKDVKEIAFSMK
jgi:beta-glucosidase